MLDLTYALGEEIGDPDLFVGRKKELARLTKWAAGAKRRISLSTGILSRRKKGKTALLQRFFNILYTRNDPQLIPFYYRIPEEHLPKTTFELVLPALAQPVLRIHHPNARARRQGPAVRPAPGAG